MLTIKTIKGKKYAYAEKSVRIGNTVRKISKYLGPYPPTSPAFKVAEAPVEYNEEFLQKEKSLRVQYLSRQYTFTYPFTQEEAEKIEEMNLKYWQIMKRLHSRNREDLYKRFIANYVFESNALEGNSLTLKNMAEVLFEHRISSGKDLREIYDAQNSYDLFVYLQESRKPLSHEFIIDLHRRLLDKIDGRIGYRTVPVILLGKSTTTLSKPEHIFKDMEHLLQWYKEYNQKLHPLELAVRFHAQFEKIHPFCDGNGRMGRFLLNYILLRKKYFPIIIRKTSRSSYLKALDAADHGTSLILMRFALKHYKETFRKFFEIYYEYL